MEKSCRKYASKASTRPFLIFINNPKQPLHARFLLKIRYFEYVFKFIFYFEPSAY